MSSSDPAAFFDRDADRYDASYAERSPGGHTLRTRLAVALELLGEGSGSVLDVGMGPGRLSQELARRGFAVSGVDASDEMVALARERLPEARERLVQGDLLDLPFPDGSFDAVVATGVLEYVPDKQRAVEELARVLRPGGLAVVSLPNVRAPYVMWRRAVAYPLVRLFKRRFQGSRPAPLRRQRPPSRRRFRELLASAGLAVEAERYAAFLALPSPLDDLFPTPAVRLSERLERSGSRLALVLATQLVFAARRTAHSAGRAEG